MSFGWSAATWLAIGAGVSAAAGVAGVAQGMDSSRRSSNMAKDAAKANAQASDEANNKANAKTPDSAAAMAAQVISGKAGASGTMLTGPSGVDPNSLLLGKTTLLGGSAPPGG